MLEFDVEQISEEDMIEIAVRIIVTEEKDFEKLKSERCCQAFLHAITLNQDGNKYAVSGIRSLMKLKRLFMDIYVRYYEKSHEQMKTFMDKVIQNYEEIKKLYEMSVSTYEVHKDLMKLSPYDASILALFLGVYRDENGKVPEKVQDYNRSVLEVLSQKSPIGKLDQHPIRHLKEPQVLYRCFMEQCAIDGTIDTEEWPDSVYDILRDFKLSDRSKSEIKTAVKHEMGTAVADYFTEKYTRKNGSILDTDFIIAEESTKTSAANEESDTLDKWKQNQQGDKDLETNRNAFAFYQKRIMIVYRPELEQEAEYFLSIMNDNRNQLNPLLPALSRCELNEYLKKRRKIESQNVHIIMLGDSDEAKKLYKKANRGRWDYYKFGMRYVSSGNKTVLLVRPLKNEQINGIVELAREVDKKHPVKIPQDVESVHFTFMKELFEGGFDDLPSGVASIIAGILLAPLLALGQTMEAVVNGIQSGQNLAAKKELEFLEYCIAMYQYLESENALLV